MSSRRIAPACDRRQLPWSMSNNMGSPTNEPRPLRLPFLEADVSRTVYDIGAGGWYLGVVQ